MDGLQIGDLQLNPIAGPLPSGLKLYLTGSFDAPSPWDHDPVSVSIIGEDVEWPSDQDITTIAAVLERYDEHLAAAEAFAAAKTSMAAATLGLDSPGFLFWPTATAAITWGVHFSQGAPAAPYADGAVVTFTGDRPTDVFDTADGEPLD